MYAVGHTSPHTSSLTIVMVVRAVLEELRDRQEKSVARLNSVIIECAFVFQSLPSEAEALLVRWNAWFLGLDLRFHAVDSITCFHIESEFISHRPGLDEDLHAIRTCL